MPARSIRSPRDCCRSRSEKRPRPWPSSWRGARSTVSPRAAGALYRPNHAGAAALLGGENRGRARLRPRTRRRGGGYRATPGGDSSPRIDRDARSRSRGARGRVRQGNLCARARSRPRPRAQVPRACRGAAAHGGRAVRRRRRLEPRRIATDLLGPGRCPPAGGPPAGRGRGGGLAGAAGEPRRRRAPRARAGGAAAGARRARHRRLGGGFLPGRADRAGRGRERRGAAAAHLQSAARLTQDGRARSLQPAATFRPAISAGVGRRFAILPRLRGRGPRTLLVVTALDDIPARPPTVTPNNKDNPMSITAGRKAEVIKTYATKAGDTGSPEVQVAILSERINSLTEHFKT